ncbi:MAG: ankyrin repeat domain-containing protein [Puniceicoccales bacterium]|jgi:hypothetical protein|nr:ankyrin repeat domain-containing protein [Puniceicoccales bacterium]
MEIKSNQSEWRSALVAGLFLSCGMVLKAETTAPQIPCWSAMSDDSKRDVRVVIGTNVARTELLGDLVNSFLTGKSIDPNKKVIVGPYLPLIFFAASVSGASYNTAETHPVKKLLDNNDTDVAVQTTFGDTPLHVAAMNSNVATQLLIDDGRLDVNEHNSNGETPYYRALYYGKTDCATTLVNSPKFFINSRDNHGRTILHVAVRDGADAVVTKLINEKSIAWNDHSLEVNIKDAGGKTPADYLEDVDDIDTRAIIQDALKEGGATYGKVGRHITDYNAGDGTYKLTAHAENIAVVESTTAS